MGKNYGHYSQQLLNNGSHGRAQGSRPQGSGTKRIWVKRVDGNPTTIMTGPDDLIDDLKLAVLSKFPNSLAKMCDPADLQILIRVNGDKSQTHNRLRMSKLSYNRIIEESNEDTQLRSPTNGSASQIQVSHLQLEPDQNIWELVDEYFPQSMTMADAFFINVPGNPYSSLPTNSSLTGRLEHETKNGDPHRIQSPLPQTANQRGLSSDVHPISYHHPRPQYPSEMGVKQSNNRKNESASPSLTNRNSPVQQVANHRRSQSNPPQSPVSFTQNSKASNSQAVLLLPKNFSLSDQHSTKRLSVDDRSVPNRISANGAISKNYNSDHSNVTSTGVERPNERELDRNQTSNVPQVLLVENLQGRQSTNEIEEATDSPRMGSGAGNSKVGTNLPDKKSDIRKLTVRSKGEITEKTINTSTFEKVLPLISVLVVEDNSINQAILGAFLRRHKIHYQLAKNGQEAIDKWKKGGFHLVLMDIQLPVKSGIEATKEIRYLEKINRIGVFAQHELANTNYSSHFDITEEEKLDLSVFRSPVIIVALTASSNSSVDKKNALTAGCNDFLTKPVNLVWLQNKINEWGCMQALIDFDGWKFKNAANPASAVPSTKLGNSKAKKVRGSER